jgi:hypothetical protein
MSQRYLLLVIEPVVVVRTIAGIQNPLLKSKATIFRVVRNWLSIGTARVLCKMDDPLTLLALVPVNFTSRNCFGILPRLP